MKFPCPRCNKPVELGYLEKKGDQMVCCPNCDTVVAATYKKDADRYYWEVYIEKTRPKKPFGGGCWTAIGFVIIVSVLIAAAQCPWKVPHPLPETQQETEEEEQAPDQPPDWY
ncbi:MAG: hypothetical protein AB7U82_19400 [Blastocatellales bacterium]